MKLRCLLKPNTRPELRPDPEDPSQRDAVIYVRSILLMRLGVGVSGLLLPFALGVTDWAWFSGDPAPRGSMSAYYYSGMHDVFVTVIFGIGAFLVGYKIAECSLDNTMSILAGLGAMCLAWFPTAPGDNKDPAPVLSPLQQDWGAKDVRHLHTWGTAFFIGGLIVVSILFGLREGRQKPVPGKLPPWFWRWFHMIAAALMVVGALWIRFGVGFKLASLDVRRTFIGEVLCVGAFSVSWLLKGAEKDTLFARPVDGRRRPKNSTTQGNPAPPGTDDV